MKVLNKDFFIEIIKSVFSYILISFIFIFVFALILMNTDIDGKIIWWITEFLKIMSLFIAIFINVCVSKGIVKGLFTGLLGAVFLSVIFLIFGLASFNIKSFAIEIAYTSIMGGIFGILAVNRKRR